MKQFFKKPSLLFLAVFLGWLFFGIMIFIFQSKDTSLSLNNLGMFGDSFNILTSLFTGLAFAGVIISVRLQKEELNEVRKEFEEQTKALESQQKEMVIQSFDNKFFQMLNLFNNVINNLTYEDYSDNKSNEGVKCNVYEKRKVLMRIKTIFEYKNRNKDLTFLKVPASLDMIDTIEKFQTKFYKLNQEHDTTLKFYFINLYQILKYIDKQFANDIESARNYTNIVRAQLSKDELVLLFYNAIGVIPFSGDNYKKLVEKYSFFEHLTYNDLNPNNDRRIVDKLLKEYNIKAFGKNEDLKRRVLAIQGSE